jgi:hypothetical protein
MWAVPTLLLFRRTYSIPLEEGLKRDGLEGCFARRAARLVEAAGAFILEWATVL